MGNFYTNLVVRGPSQQAVANELKGRNALLSPPLDGYIVVFDEQCEKQDPEVVARLAARLSKAFSCPVLASMNHDDDVLWLQLYSDGRLVDEYNSSPSYFDPKAKPSDPKGGDARVLCAAFASTNADQVESVLRKSSFTDNGYAFAIERHADLAGALGLPRCVAGGGFQYITEGEIPEGLMRMTF